MKIYVIYLTSEPWKIVPDEAAAAEGLPDEDLLLHGRFYPELHALGDGHFPIYSPSILVNCFVHSMSIVYKYL